MIKIRNLAKTYSTKAVLHDINLDIDRGEIHGILGTSGAGKSTLLRCINGLEECDGGASICVDGTEINSLSSPRLRAFRKNIGMIFQDFALLQRKTALENVMLPMQCWQINPAQATAQAMELLRRVGIVDQVHCHPTRLSGGQKQRVAIARALALKPQVLLCDEATSALDPLTTKSILELLKTINQELGITIIMVTHQMDVIKYLCDKLTIIERGRVVKTDTVSAIFMAPPTSLCDLAANRAMPLACNEIGFIITLAHIEQSTSVILALAEAVNSQFRILHAQTDCCKTAVIVHYTIAIVNQHSAYVVSYFNEHNIQFRTL